MTDNITLADNASPAFRQLYAAYLDRCTEAKRARRSGKSVVGYVGNTVPVELIIAAGCYPLRLAPVSGGTATADHYIETFADMDTRLIVEQFMAGELDFLTLIIIPRSTESYHKLYLSLREVKRVGATQRGPDITLYEILHTQQRSSREYGLARTRDLAQRLSAIGAAPIDDGALRGALAATNQTRNLLAKLQQARRSVEKPPSGYAAHVVAVAASFLEPRLYNSLLADWIGDWIGEAASQTGGWQRLLVQGCPLDHAYLHRLVDLAGGLVVAEDGDWGARQAAPVIAGGGDPLAAIFEHYYAGVPCPRLFPQAVADRWFMETLHAGGIDGVIFYLPTPDDIFGWEFPSQRAAVEAAGLTWTLIRKDVRFVEERPAVATQLNAYMATLGSGHRAHASKLTTIS
ncbi:MAG: 2-hydroxyacyl-CoA dehydratase family protein [Proteobacteria bacterium]|nr:2-hydroxyacyl-CoA dehydratase family protein [Pseudomonadota bacterium]